MVPPHWQNASATPSMSAAELTAEPPAAEGIHPYRAVSRSAIVSLVLGFASSLSLIFASLLVLPLVGLVLGLVARSTIRRYPAEYTGSGLATAGIVCCAIFFLGGAARHTFDYVTEVPDGYARVGFWELQPDPDHPELPVSPKALELSGKPIFIKGYMHPGVASMGKVDHFILVPDMGTCCFGGQPKPTDMIEVRIPDAKQRLAYSTTRVKLAGKFQLSLQPGQSLGLANVWYHLTVNEVR
jgi:hypothetical protein